MDMDGIPDLEIVLTTVEDKHRLIWLGQLTDFILATFQEGRLTVL